MKTDFRSPNLLNMFGFSCDAGSIVQMYLRMPNTLLKFQGGWLFHSKWESLCHALEIIPVDQLGFATFCSLAGPGIWGSGILRLLSQEGLVILIKCQQIMAPLQNTYLLIRYDGESSHMAVRSSFLLGVALLYLIKFYILRC